MTVTLHDRVHLPEPNFDRPLSAVPPPLPKDQENTADLIDGLVQEVLELKTKLKEAQARIPPEPAPAPAPTDKPDRPKIVLRPLHEIVAEKREPAWFIRNVLERQILGILAGQRGTFKSFVAFHWAMTVAMDNLPVAILSGEGAGLDRRADAWMREHGKGTALDALPVTALERPLNLILATELAELREAFAESPRPPVLIVVDTLSKFSAGLDENSNGEVAAYLSGLSAELREAFQATVLLVVHSGHGDTGRPRGASALMANPDCEWVVQRPNPQSMTITVTRERFKDGPALPPLGYEAKVIDLGRVDQYGEPVTSLALVTADAPLISNAKGRGRNQDKVIVALKEWHRTHPGETQITSMDIRAICKAQHINRNREREVIDAFVNARILTPSIGGHTLHGENL